MIKKTRDKLTMILSVVVDVLSDIYTLDRVIKPAGIDIGREPLWIIPSFLTEIISKFATVFISYHHCFAIIGNYGDRTVSELADYGTGNGVLNDWSSLYAFRSSGC